MRTLNVIVYAVALVLAVAAYFKGEQRHITGDPEASKTLLLVPTLIGAFLIAGYVRVLVPEDVMRSGLGRVRPQRDISWLYSRDSYLRGSLHQFSHPASLTMWAGAFKPSQCT